MNIALPRTRTGHKAPYLAALFAGLSILALTAGVGVWRAIDSGNAGPAATSISSTYHVTRTPTLVLYIVESDEQADLIRADENAAALNRFELGYPEPDQQLVILKATTPEEELNVAEVMEAWMGSGSFVHLFDVRGR